MNNTQDSEPLRPFTIYWIGGNRSILWGHDIVDAFSRAGYGHGATAAVDWYESGASDSHVYDRTTSRWVRRLSHRWSAASVDEADVPDIYTKTVQVDDVDVESIREWFKENSGKWSRVQFVFSDRRKVDISLCYGQYSDHSPQYEPLEFWAKTIRVTAWTVHNFAGLCLDTMQRSDTRHYVPRQFNHFDPKTGIDDAINYFIQICAANGNDDSSAVVPGKQTPKQIYDANPILK